MITKRTQFVDLIDGGIGVELGVAKGKFSEWLLQYSNLKLLVSVDNWGGRRHNDSQAEHARKRLARFGFRSVILRMLFSDAVRLFADDTFDFVYIDGNAQWGPKEAIEQWWPKCKLGGVFSGHDYHERWPRTMQDVDRVFSGEYYLTNDDPYPSWWLHK